MKSICLLVLLGLLLAMAMATPANKLPKPQVEFDDEEDDQDVNGDVDIDGGNLTVGTGLQFTNAGVFNFGSDLDNGRITWGTEFASLYGLSATTKLRLGSMATQGVLTISSSHENTMVISGSNVGIGTSSPDAFLHILGGDENTLKLMGIEGRKNVLKKFDVEKMCTTTITEYKKLIN